MWRKLLLCNCKELFTMVEFIGNGRPNSAKVKIDGKEHMHTYQNSVYVKDNPWKGKTGTICFQMEIRQVKEIKWSTLRLSHSTRI